MKFVIDDFKGWSMFDYSWLLASVICMGSLSVYWGDPYIATMCSIVNIVCAVLTIKGKLSNFVWGTVGLAIYTYIACYNQIYEDALLNLVYYAPVQFLGYILWSNNIRRDGEFVAKRLNSYMLSLVILVSSIGIWLYGNTLITMGEQIPMFEAASTILSVVASILMICQFKEQWLFWIFVNLISIVSWVAIDTVNVSVLLMWMMFLVNSIIGLYKWNTKI
ncbi:MAG: nicotinamide riboside transporter PnuC [Fusobacteriaceae bacterium]